MSAYWIAAGSALWLGVLTSISPCPLASNIAAISFLGRTVERPRHVLAAGLLYTFGRVLTYTVLGAAMVAGLYSVPAVSNFLQAHMNRILGPVLILVGMFLLQLLSLPMPSGMLGKQAQALAQRGGLVAAFLLGVLFALSFCPVSAALFFGSLLGLAVKQESYVVLPAIYGAGTGLPVFAFAILVMAGAQAVGRAFHRLTQVEKIVRNTTGVVFILAGVHYTLRYIFEVPIG